MNIKIDFNSPDLPGIVAMLLVAVSFCSYWFLFISERYRQFCYARFPGDEGKIIHIVSLKYIGFGMFSILPTLVFKWIIPGYDLLSLGVSSHSGSAVTSLLWIIGLGIPIVVAMRVSCKRPHAFECYPQIRVAVWDSKLILRYCLSWAFYMAGYEIMFRGLLLFPLIKSFGVLPAIAINTIFYSCSHIPKGSAETFSSLFFGPLLCFITIQTGNIWAAAGIHVILAVSNSMMALFYHPSMVIVKNRTLELRKQQLKLMDA